MIDINYSLRIAVNNALTGIAGIKAYYNHLPNTLTPVPDCYLIFRSITSNDISTKHSSDTNTFITIDIHTREQVSNPGLNNDTTAREVYNRIYPNPQFNLTIDGAQIVNTKMINDITDEPIQQGSVEWLSRHITFGFNIFQRSDIS